MVKTTIKQNIANRNSGFSLIKATSFEENRTPTNKCVKKYHASAIDLEKKKTIEKAI